MKNWDETAWAQWYPAYTKACAQLGMKPETPGPLPDAGARAALRNISEADEWVQKALAAKKARAERMQN